VRIHQLLLNKLSLWWFLDFFISLGYALVTDLWRNTSCVGAKFTPSLITEFDAHCVIAGSLTPFGKSLKSQQSQEAALFCDRCRRKVLCAVTRVKGFVNVHLHCIVNKAWSLFKHEVYWSLKRRSCVRKSVH